jgi:hypothetical protein
MVSCPVVEGFMNADSKLLKKETGAGKIAGDIDLALPFLITATVERANPAAINKIGKMVSIPSVFLSLTCIRIFFFMTVIVWLKNTFFSA